MKREEAIRIINDERVKYNIWETPHDISEEEWEEAFCMAVEALENYVEVVRCKDCKWYNKSGCAIYIADDTDKPTENDFCSFGERADK